MKYDGRLYTQAEVDAMNNTPKTVESLINEAETKWASQGRTDEQKWAVRNFITGSMQEAITALNELIRNERIDELNKLMDYTDENEIVCVCEQANVQVCDHNWSLCHTARERIAELRAEERLQK